MRSAVPRWQRWVASAALGLSLLACNAPHSRAPVVERSPAPARAETTSPETYTVRKNDTLYSIAWRHNLDYKVLAAANGIESPYTVYPGQRIDLAATAPAPTATVQRPTPATPSQRPAAPSPATKPAPARPVAAAPASPSRAPKPPLKPATASSPPPAPLPSAAGGWRHPVHANPERRFGGTSKGLDYTLTPETRIHAAAAGDVVYAGPGLGGYRHLVIVKVGERYLVAYGVNVAPALSEGEKVAAGGTVATIGGGGAAAGRFHFEIRDRGKPVDPYTLIGRQ